MRNTITTTDLRTRSSQLVAQLSKGDSLSLVHRSKVIGVIQPATQYTAFNDATGLKKLVRSMKPMLAAVPRDPAARDKIYQESLKQKYGRHLS